MQGGRSVIDSLSETLDFERGSSSSNPVIDTQIHWGSMMNHGDLDTQGFLLSPGVSGYERRKLNLGESSSSTRPNEVSKQDERISDHGWPSLLTASAGMGPRLQDWPHDPNSMFMRNNDNVNSNSNRIMNVSLFGQNSTSDGSGILPNLNLDAGFVGNVGDDCQVIENPNAYNSSGSTSRQVTSAGDSSDQFGTPPGSNVRREGSVEGRSSVKRKFIDLNVGQSSAAGSSRYSHHAENIGWYPATSRPVAARSLNISTPSHEVTGSSTLEHTNPRLGLRPAGSGSHRDSNISTSQRNVRIRQSSASPQESVPSNVVPSRSTHLSLNQQLAMIPPVNHFIDVGQTLAIDNTNHQNQTALPHLHASPQQVQPARLTREIIPAHHEGSLRNMPRQFMENPLFQPTTESRSVTQSSVQRTLASGSTITHRNGRSSRVTPRNGPSSTPRSGSTSVVRPSHAHPGAPHLPASHTRRLTEHVRRALLSVSGPESAGQIGNHPPPQSGPSASSQEAMVSLNQRHPSHSLRALAAGEVRSRLVSEMRDAIDNYRRGGDVLRFQDFMLLDQSLIFGVAEAHDRHRDMRLDVDNMSYEELLALGERIGDVNTGVKEETIMKVLKHQKYFCMSLETKSEDEPCSICREEYQDGEDLGVLSCGHDFHTPCIKQWLGMKNLCPICKTTAINEKKT